MRLAVCGSPEYPYREHVRETLYSIHRLNPIDTICISPVQEGVNRYAHEWACSARVDVEMYDSIKDAIIDGNPDNLLTFAGCPEEVLDQYKAWRINVFEVRTPH